MCIRDRYYRLEDAQEKAKKLAEERYQTAVAKIAEKQLLGFYTNLFTMGVNCLAVNEGTDMAIRIQLSELVARKKPENLPEGQKLVENPALHLTALYFMPVSYTHLDVYKRQLLERVRTRS